MSFSVAMFALVGGETWTECAGGLVLQLVMFLGRRGVASLSEDWYPSEKLMYRGFYMHEEEFSEQMKDR